MKRVIISFLAGAAIVPLAAVTLIRPTPRLIWNATSGAPIVLYWVASASTPRIDDLLEVRAPETIACLTDERGYMIVLNVGLAAPQADVRADLVGRKAEKTSSNRALKSCVEEASKRLLIPTSLIWAVMKVESAGDDHALSSKGAMGLMQIMPKTWEMLRHQHALGGDPFASHDNILAGAAYLRQLHDRYGESGFMAAYNPGPGPYEEHLDGRSSLPPETVKYVLNVSRWMGSDVSVRSFPDVNSRLSASVAPLFPASKIDPQIDDSTDQNRITESAISDQHVVDLSAITPQSYGLFVSIRSR